jgi:uncharacterized protein (TIGR03435 family)
MGRWLVVLAIVGSVVLIAQAPAFDAVSIKVNRSSDQGSRGRTRPGSLVISNTTLLIVIRNTWNLNPMQIVGGPSWMNVERFDITATAAGNPDRNQMNEMTKTMLAERFKLVVHTETRQLPVYALVLATPDGRLGPALRRSDAGCQYNTPAVPDAPPQPAPASLAGVDLPACGTNFNNDSLRAGGITLEMFARNIAAAAGRIIVDRTGLAGMFDIALRFNPDPAAPSDAPSLFAAMQEQLGLRLDAQIGPAQVLVIDSAQQPTAD